MFHYVYIIRSQQSGKLYTGYTRNLSRRISSHQHGMSEFTRKGKDWKLIYAEAYISGEDARNRELFLKSGRGREIIRKQLKNTLAGMVELADTYA